MLRVRRQIQKGSRHYSYFPVVIAPVDLHTCLYTRCPPPERLLSPLELFDACCVSFGNRTTCKIRKLIIGRSCGTISSPECFNWFSSTVCTSETKRLPARVFVFFVRQLRPVDEILISDSASLARGVITFRINPTKNSTHDTTFVYLLHQLLQMLAAGFWWTQLHGDPTVPWNVVPPALKTRLQMVKGPTDTLKNDAVVWSRSLYHIWIHLLSLSLSISVKCTFTSFTPVWRLFYSDGT